MSKEQIEKLITFLYCNSKWGDLDEDIKKWFEQNPQEPVVVGLDIPQLDELCDRLKDEVPKDRVINAYYRMCDENIFVQKENVFVGLSEEQFKKVARHLANGFDSDDYIGYEAELRRALGEKTFAQPQQFQPDWDDAPDAVSCRVDLNFDNKDGNLIKIVRDFEVIESPTTPAPVVEVGQVWLFKDENVWLNKVKIIGICYDELALQSISSGFLSLENLDYFLDKFEMVAE